MVCSMITLGMHSYMGKVLELFYPVVQAGKFCSISDDVTFMGNSSEHPTSVNPRTVSSYPFKELGWGDYTPAARNEIDTARGPIIIGSDVWIGHGALIMDRAHIGHGCIIGARAVIRGSVPPYAVVVGNPGIIKRYRFDQQTIDRLLEIQWWDWPESKIKEFLWAMKDVDLFLRAVADNEFEESQKL